MTKSPDPSKAGALIRAFLDQHSIDGPSRLVLGYGSDEGAQLEHCCIGAVGAAARAAVESDLSQSLVSREGSWVLGASLLAVLEQIDPDRRPLRCMLRHLPERCPEGHLLPEAGGSRWVEAAKRLGQQWLTQATPQRLLAFGAQGGDAPALQLVYRAPKSHDAQYSVTFSIADILAFPDSDLQERLLLLVRLSMIQETSRAIWLAHTEDEDEARALMNTLVLTPVRDARKKRKAELTPADMKPSRIPRLRSIGGIRFASDWMDWIQLHDELHRACAKRRLS